MRVFIFTFSREYNRALAIELIPLGIEPVEIESKTALLESTAKYPDIRNLITEYPDIDLVYQLKNIQSDIRITLILHTRTRKDEVMRLSKTGVRYLLNFHEDPSEMAEEILNTLILEQKKNHEKRLHYRVQPYTVGKARWNDLRARSEEFHAGRSPGHQRRRFRYPVAGEPGGG